MAKPPIITIDGPAAVGKGTITLQLANTLKWHILESGALYRLLALKVLQDKIDLNNLNYLLDAIKDLDLEFIIKDNSELHILLDQKEVSNNISSEECGNMASQVGVIPQVRTALLEKQRKMLRPPGLIADGRDMGTVVFPEANIKIFLQASLTCRALRRFNQLKNKGHYANLEEILQNLALRDKRDQERAVAPLKPAADAIIIDTTHLEPSAVFEQILTVIQEQGII